MVMRYLKRHEMRKGKRRVSRAVRVRRQRRSIEVSLERHKALSGGYPEDVWDGKPRP